ncbi:hypothetical protein ACFQZO_23985 [Bradyrhizobium sp. GCM10027634]|uniref:hypothetical protein n=1 Tax=unclassified Bradyrhizobium TaxID=2631580 RepID=UPI00188B97AB|nr:MULTISPECIES: hypothetical protein [unclassified Bradyrhizobium]MDN5003901.1 hypothetical protein [Bradyrhizobium sp. WYCCWR 12677]QOZ45437.1 hypothetical protein XH89_19565 [Bradyrhizobium sp. CCBAU 53340]
MTGYKTADIVEAIIKMQGIKAEQIGAQLGKQFPGASDKQITQALNLAALELREMARRDFAEARELYAIVRRRHPANDR